MGIDGLSEEQRLDEHIRSWWEGDPTRTEERVRQYLDWVKSGVVGPDPTEEPLDFVISPNFSGGIREFRHYTQRLGYVAFQETIETLKEHIYFEEKWEYDLIGLFVLQSELARLLPGVFYLFLAGRFGAGKSALLQHLTILTHAISFSNVSTAALVRIIDRELTPGRRIPWTVTIDEFDVGREGEAGELLDAVLRQGYRRDAAPYVRWNIATRSEEEFHVYGPKAVAFRGLIDDALLSRGFSTPMSRPTGPSWHYIYRTIKPKWDSVQENLEEFWEGALLSWGPEDVLELMKSPKFIERIRQVIPGLEAGREMEIVTYALLVAEIAGLNVTESLRKAVEVSRVALFPEEVYELKAVLLEMLLETPEKDGIKRVRQKDVKGRFDGRRLQYGKRPSGTRQFAMLRREVIPEPYLTRKGNAIVWRIPSDFKEELQRDLSET